MSGVSEEQMGSRKHVGGGAAVRKDEGSMLSDVMYTESEMGG